MNSSEAGDAPRVLIIEDEDGLRAAYERILRAAGMVVTACASAEAALERLRSGERFSVVVTDLVMSGMSGVDLLPVIRQSDPDVCIVIVTGRPSLRSSIAAIENGGFKYLLKPIAPRELCKTVNDAAARYRLATLTRRALEISAEDGRVSASGEELSRAFQTALDQLFIAYQPIVHAGGGTFGFEALVRTSDTTFRGPNQLFDAAERLGRVQDLSRSIRSTVGRDALRAPDASVLFVNLHSADLADPELYAETSPLTRHASRVVLEVTERRSLDGTPDVRSRIAELRRLGYRIAVDDLGAGYAGLSCVSLLEPDIVKLDMSLIRDIDRSSRKRSLVASMLRVCQVELGMQVVCEGVETNAEYETLVADGATLLQGYLFARPQREFQLNANDPAQSGYLRLREVADAKTS